MFLMNTVKRIIKEPSKSEEGWYQWWGGYDPTGFWTDPLTGNLKVGVDPSDPEYAAIDLFDPDDPSCYD